ncbi:MAG: ribonuclease HI [Roseiflexus sp.]|nr:ribonuclease HI [Roseiflexus sp.]
MVDIYTDGACRGNPGPGGWAAIIVRNGDVIEIGGAEEQTTNNRMELRAAVEALRRVPPDTPVRLTTDSAYLLNGATRWLPLWKQRNWLTADDAPVEHRDLWEELDALAGQRVTWNYVRGHSGDPWNERANLLAQAYADGRVETLSGAPARRRISYLSLVRGELARHATWEECRGRIHGVSGARWKKCTSPEEERATVTNWGMPVEALAALDAGDSQDSGAV